MSRSFDDLPWHDAVILAIDIDRTHPGVADVVTFLMLWPNGPRSEIRFLECYAFIATMNFGVVASETVKSAGEAKDSEQLRILRDTWRGLGVDLATLNSYSI